MSDAPSGADVPVYAVRLSPAASAQAVAEYDRLTQTADTEAAEDWREGLRAAWAGLARLPQRCPVAPEDAAFQQFSPGPPLRVFLYRRGSRRSAWRLLFTIHEADAHDPATVRVQHIRHSAQLPLSAWPAEDTEP